MPSARVQRLRALAADPRNALVAFGAALLLAAGVAWVHVGHWTPAYTDYKQEGDRYTYPLNGKIAEKDGVSYYWARCGHEESCGPIAFLGDPVPGLSHVVLLVPSGDPEAAMTPLPNPVEAECQWSDECPGGNATVVTHAWGPYRQAAVRWQQAAVGLTIALLGSTLANALRGPNEGVRAFLALSAGALLAANLALDSMLVGLLTMLVVLPALVALGLLGLAGRRWPLAGRLSMVLLWALLGWVVQALMFAPWFPGPPTM